MNPNPTSPQPSEREEGWTELLAKARDIVIEHRRGSISLVQRLLLIRYNDAALLLEELERRGVVGPIQGNGGRLVLVPSPQKQNSGDGK